MSTTVRSMHWVESLAQQERSLQRGERSSVDLTAAREQVLRAETSSYLRELVLHFSEMIDHFNRCVGASQLQVRLERSDGVGEFSLGRASFRMSVAARKYGVVQLRCDKVLAGAGAERTGRSTVMFSSTVEAQFGPLDEVFWSFLGNSVTAELVSRHHFTEFLQMSRAPQSL